LRPSRPPSWSTMLAICLGVTQPLPASQTTAAPSGRRATTDQCFHFQLACSKISTNVPKRNSPFWILMPSLLQAVFWHTARLVDDISMSHQWAFIWWPWLGKDKPKRYVAGDMMNDFHPLDSNLVSRLTICAAPNHRQQPLEAWTRAGGARL